MKLPGALRFIRPTANASLALIRLSSILIRRKSRIKNRALSADEIADLYSCGEIADSSSSPTTPDIRPSCAVAVNASSLTFSNGGEASWFAQSAVSRDVCAAQSDAIDDDEVSWLQTTLHGPGTLTFWWKVSSEDGYDILTLSVDGVVRNSMSGETDWVRVSRSFTDSGSHTIRWTYSKDVSY